MISLKTNGCPGYLRFKASDDGETLQLVAKNLNHNHELKLPIKKSKSLIYNSYKPRQKKTTFENMDAVNTHEPKEEYEILEGSSEKEIAYAIQDEKLDFEFFKYQGLIAPVFTPFNDDLSRSLNLEILPVYAQYLIDNGLSGVLVNGTTGEGPSMTVAERKLVTEVWSQLCVQGQLHLMVQVGGAPLPDVLDLVQHAEQNGANSILCLPELYNKPSTCEDLMRYLQIVSQAAPNTPLFYYHIPSLTNVNLHMGEFLRKMNDSVPTFSGIKFTSTVLDEGYEAVTANNSKYSVFLGADGVMAGAYALGFDSSIATTLNMFSQYGQQILQNMKDGNIKEAQQKQNDLNSAIEVITKCGGWVRTMKTAMNLLTPLTMGPTREPIKPLTAEESKQMENDLMGLSFITS